MMEPYHIDQSVVAPGRDASYRVGIFCDTDSRGGVFTYSMSLCRQLRRCGHRAILLVPEPRSRADWVLLEEMQGAADRVVLVGGDRGTRPYLRSLRSAITAAGIDIFIPNYRVSSYAACAGLAAGERPRIVGICHDNTKAYFRMLGYYKGIISCFVSPNFKVYENLISFMCMISSDIHHVPHGIEVSSSRPASPPDRAVRLLYHGRLVEDQKNVSHLVRLGGLLLRRGIPFTLRLVGEGEARAFCHTLIHELGLEEHVELHDACPPEKLGGYFEDSHLAVLTSSHEGFCLGLAEAMGAGLPALAYSCGGVIEEYLIDHVNGFVVPFGDLEAMADRVEFLFKNPQVWRAFSEVAKRTIGEKYDIVRFGERYADLFRRMMRNPPKPPWPSLRPTQPCRRYEFWGSGLEKIGAFMGWWDDLDEVDIMLARLNLA